jgi:ABC-type dipeptide/oligopeptide/nickel transport system permease subunit
MSIGTSELLVEPEANLDVHELAGREVAARSPRQLFWRRFRSDRVAMASAAFIILLILIAIFAPLVIKILGVPGPNVNDPNATDAFGSPLGPTAGHPFGVDQLGRDVLSRTIYGARVSLIVGIAGTLIATMVGTVVGLLAGYYRGWVDTFVSRIVEVFLAFPVLVLGLGIGAACGVRGCLNGLIQPGLGTVIFIIVISSFTYIARIARGQVLSLREKEFVEASRSLGASNTRILFREILPNLVAPLIVYSSLLIPTNILLEAALSFLGVGIRPPTASWGQMISVGDGLLDALNPRGESR